MFCIFVMQSQGARALKIQVMKYFVYLNGFVVVFKHTQIQIPFEYWDNEVKVSMETLDNVEVLKLSQIASDNFPSVEPSEWDILEVRDAWKICVFQ